MSMHYVYPFTVMVFFNSLPHNPDLTTFEKTTFENIAGKGENACHQHFLLFPQCFLSVPKQILIFQSH